MARTPRTYPIDTGRLRNVVELATGKAGWGRKLPERHGLGLAVHRSFVTYVAAVVEAAVDAQGNVTVPRVDIAVDCGPTVNPDRVRSQIEGACVMGLTLALKSEITFKDGKVQQGNFDEYDVVRNQRGADPDQCAYRAARFRYAARRGGRARRAADRASPDQCDLRGDRQAHPRSADRRPAQGLNAGAPSPALSRSREGACRSASRGQRHLRPGLFDAKLWRRGIISTSIEISLDGPRSFP